MSWNASTPERVIEHAEHQMLVQGYVRWSDIAEALGISRQRVAQCLESAVKSGHTTAVRADILRKSMQKSLVRHEYVLTESNRQWLLDQAEALNLSHHDVLNRVLLNHILNDHANVNHPQP